ncbi:MAG: ABC transporter permease [Gemmatimonadota bacterium]
MNRGRSWSYRLLGLVLDRLALWVPPARRGRWLEEWRSETWHAFDSGRAGGRAAVAFAWGALRDAHDVRRRSRGDRGPGLGETTRQDLRLAFRSLVSRPGYTALVVTILALGIGANTAVFSLARDGLVSALPYPDAERLVRIWERRPEQGRERNTASLPDYVDWRDRSSSFEAMTTYRVRPRNFSTEATPRRILGAQVTRGFFRVFDVQPVSGRTFTPEEWSELGEPVLLLSHRLWVERYGADPGIVGKGVSVDLTRHTVVGVMPPEFDYPYEAEYWFPATDDPTTASRGSHRYSVLGKLLPGVGIERARQDLDATARDLEAEYPDTNRGHYTAVYDLRGEILGDTGPVLLVLLGAVGVVLLIVCVNVANMALVRSAVRTRSLAIRASLGASRGRLVRQQLTESLLLAVLAGAASIAVAGWTHALLRGLGASRVPWASPLHLDLQVFLVVLVLACLTGVLFGLVPALAASRVDVAGRLRDGSRTTGLARAARRWQGGLVVTQIALALVLLAGAGLLTHNLAALVSTDVGFETENRILADLNLPPARYAEPEDVWRFHTAVQERVAALPGVKGVALSWILPMSGREVGRNIWLEGRAPPENADEWTTRLRAVSNGYFDAVGMRVLEGRAFEAADGPEARPVAVINERLRRRYWPERSSLGDRLAFGPDGPWITIVGVVNDVRHEGPQQPPDPELYLTLAQQPIGQVSLVVHTEGGIEVEPDALRAAVAEVDPEQPLADIRTFDDAVAAWLGDRREVASLLGAFALVALVLAALGIYGVVSYAVAQRTSEFGLRMLRGAMAGGTRLVASGLALGGLAFLPASWWLRPMLDDVGALDPLSLALAAATLGGVALLAVLVPATRATRVDPAESLRAN